ncbi:MAG: hypothetical protein EOO62_24245 [Hymenobacter sp.]|nr:MAG: hypothetical protein EOO62_24245 [Hymenobacter sp.]
MKTLLLLAGLGLAGFPAATQAQALSPVPVAVLAPPAPAAPDTVAAIHRLFGHKRRLRLAVLGANLALGTASYLDGIHTNDPVGVGLTYLVIVPIYVGTTLGILLGATHYSHRQETRALQAFELHQLPPRIRKRLKPKYFGYPGAPSQVLGPG